MSKICFVSYEIHPVTRGGCGVLLYNSARVLLEQGHQIIFVLDMPVEAFAQFDSSLYPNAHNCRAYSVRELCADLPLQMKDFPSSYVWRMYRFDWAARKVAAWEQPDLIEFFDYNGPAQYALAAKLAGLAYKNTQLAIRLHSSNQLMNLHQPSVPTTYDYYMIYALEHSALRLAETVLYPSSTYLNEAYKPHYEPWLGQTIYSKPALSDHPRLKETDQPKNKILFYGRLFGYKGVDLFVDAAVTLLDQGGYEDVCFSLVGYNSRFAPDGSRTYQEYLEKKIPNRYAAQFEFTDQISWPELERLLPEVWCAVFPSYFEAFCYAAHELYAAGIPVIVNDIAAFRGYFVHRKNALLFDGTVLGLAEQIKAMWQDQALRERLVKPYSLTDQPLGTFYEGPFEPTWIKKRGEGTVTYPSLLVCVLDEGQRAVERTIKSLGIEEISQVSVVVLKEWSHEAQSEAGAIWFLGKMYQPRDLAGASLTVTDLRTAETLLIVRAGDLANEQFVRRCLEVLGRQPELSFVSAWKRVRRQDRVELNTFPIDAALELVAFGELPLLSRAVMRTEAGRLLIDLFEPRSMQMGEVGYLWHLEERQGPGLVIPEFWLDLDENDGPCWQATLQSYLIANDTYSQRKSRLANYLMTVWAERDENAVPIEEQPRYSEEIAALVQTIGASKVGRLVGENPFIVKWSKVVLKWIRQGLKPRLTT